MLKYLSIITMLCVVAVPATAEIYLRKDTNKAAQAKPLTTKKYSAQPNAKPAAPQNPPSQKNKHQARPHCKMLKPLHHHVWADNGKLNPA